MKAGVPHEFMRGSYLFRVGLTGFGLTALGAVEENVPLIAIGIGVVALVVSLVTGLILGWRGGGYGSR